MEAQKPPSNELVIPLGYPLEFDVKMILLKTPHDLDVRCRGVKMEVN